jgi:hypothetical protein
MADVFREVEEAIREDRMQKLWRRYGTVILAGVLAIVVAVAGWVFWQSWSASQRQAETAELAAALALAQQDPDGGATALLAIAEEAGGGRATLARLYRAGYLAEAGDREGAVAAYRGIAGDGAVPDLWRDFARLMVVLHDLDAEEPGVLAATLEPLTEPGNPWRFSAQELSGLVALRQGAPERARDVFTRLAADPEAPAPVRDRAAELSVLLGEGS